MEDGRRCKTGDRKSVVVVVVVVVVVLVAESYRNVAGDCKGDADGRRTKADGRINEDYGGRSKKKVEVGALSSPQYRPDH